MVEHRTRLVEAASVPGNEQEALARLSEMAVLCAHRDGPGSVEQWRRDIEDILDERFPGLRYRGEWYPGRPLMITTNDYNLGLYNGDIGVVVRTGEGVRVVFDRGGIRSFPPGYLGEHSTVHGLTIHKSQGSQFGEAVVSLPSDRVPPSHQGTPLHRGDQGIRQGDPGRGRAGYPPCGGTLGPESLRTEIKTVEIRE